MLTKQDKTEVRQEINEAIDQLIIPQFDVILDRFDQVDKRFDRLESRFDGLEGRFDGLNDKVDLLVKLAQANDSSDLRARVSRLEDRLL